MPALLVHASGHDGDADGESVRLLSLAGDGRVLHRASFQSADGGESLDRLALVPGLAGALLDLDVTLQPEPVTTRHRLAGGSDVAICDGQLRSGCS